MRWLSIVMVLLGLSVAQRESPTPYDAPMPIRITAAQIIAALGYTPAKSTDFHDSIIANQAKAYLKTLRVSGMAAFGQGNPDTAFQSTDRIFSAGNGMQALGLYGFTNSGILRMGYIGGSYDAPTITAATAGTSNIQTCVDTLNGKTNGIPNIACASLFQTVMLGNASFSNRGQSLVVRLIDSATSTSTIRLRLANGIWNFNGATDVAGMAFHFKGNGLFDSTLTTGAPSGGTAAAWKFGVNVSAACVLDATNYVQLEVAGVLKKVALCQ